MLQLLERNIRPFTTLDNVLEQRDIFICATGGRTGHDSDPFFAVTGNGRLNQSVYLRKRVQDKLVVAAAVCFGNTVGQGHQGFFDCTESMRFAFYPLV